MTERSLEEAMKLALEALEMVDRDDNDRDFLFPNQCYQLDEAITALREALAEQPAQPQQEPVTWGVDWGRAGDIPCVSIIKRMPGGGIEVVAVEYAPYSYTSPPAQRKPLNWEPIQEFWRNNSSIDWDELEAAVEAAHGIKEKING